MNVLCEGLCGENGEYYPIWISTWEHSLMREHKEVLPTS